jgi:hypothetical protein
MWVDLIVEYVGGFAFGLLIFQSLFMRDMMGGSYPKAVGHSLYPEWVSMNFMMAGMFPTMALLMMGRDMRAMEPTQLVYWGAMSAAVGVGVLTCYPVNVWMVNKGLKHGMGTVRVLGKGGHSVKAESARWVQPIGRQVPSGTVAATPSSTMSGMTHTGEHEHAEP